MYKDEKYYLEYLLLEWCERNHKYGIGELSCSQSKYCITGTMYSRNIYYYWIRKLIICLHCLSAHELNRVIELEIQSNKDIYTDEFILEKTNYFNTYIEKRWLDFIKVYRKKYYENLYKYNKNYVSSIKICKEIKKNTNDYEEKQDKKMAELEKIYGKDISFKCSTGIQKIYKE